MAIHKVVSGGQTGTDRAALDWAIDNGIEHGGWCPAGRRAEDGEIPERYALRQTPGRNYRQRTKWNVRDSDGTLIITPTPELTSGSLWTQECARDLSRPYLHVYPCTSWREWIRTFLQTNSIRILNVAGSRGSSAKNIEAFVHEVLDEVFSNVERD
ncbi:putative molybdenum carrier protein [Nitrosospira sp. Nsp2]|uniref:putative molybdenum carrier protein n=1 Tax=Nitrosospira sp. Nsp2 TaxID=136548 RepID=UPI000D32455A|nr:putative molybdenum carrier protein [Nitrosospira sp. Nsp2]PTR17016.1 putative molybdenum carrier protein [Nitrosospira sp. Nsp2]